MISMFDDITPKRSKSLKSNDSSREHSIQDVSITSSTERNSRRTKRSSRRTLNKPNSGRQRKSPKNRLSVFIITTLILVVSILAVGFIFIGKTTITIVPQEEPITLSSNVVFTAYRNAQAGELGYRVISKSIEASDSVTATGKESVSEKASGRIIVYNDHSTKSLRLIKNTRFEAPSGEIYRIRNSVTIPGKKKDGTKGSLEVTVYADKPGESQNVTKTNTKFTIPGLKGDTRYNNFYAKLITPIAGGFVGERAVVDQNELESTRASLREQLKTKITETIKNEITDEEQMFSGGIFTEFKSAPVTYEEGGKAIIKEILNIYVPVFNENDLAFVLATSAIATPDEGVIMIDSPENIKMVVLNKEDISITNDSLIQFTLEGSTTLTWKIDEEAIKKDLVGKYSGALNTVMSAYPGIKSAQATIRPFWKKEFPTETSGISIEIINKK